MAFYANWMSDYNKLLEENSEENIKKAIKDLAYIWKDFNDYEKKAFKNLIKTKGKELELQEKQNKLKQIQQDILKIKEDLK